MQNISEYPGPIFTYFTGFIGVLVGMIFQVFTYFTGFIGVLVGMIFQVFVWLLPKGRCYCNQLNLGDVGK